MNANLDMHGAVRRALLRRARWWSLPGGLWVLSQLWLPWDLGNQRMAESLASICVYSGIASALVAGAAIGVRYAWLGWRRRDERMLKLGFSTPLWTVMACMPLFLWGSFGAVVAASCMDLFPVDVFAKAPGWANYVNSGEFTTAAMAYWFPALLFGLRVLARPMPMWFYSPMSMVI